jgi:alkylation response protein AidB-like acyl-CoA dehydrogenase
MIALSIALIAWAGAAAYSVHRWTKAEIAGHQATVERCRTTRTLSNNARAAAERLERSLAQFNKLTGAHRSDNLAPVSTADAENVVVPFGRKKPSDPPPQPEGAA